MKLMGGVIHGEHALRIAIGITVLVLLFAGNVEAKTLTVNASGGGDYAGIQHAIDNATAGDTIEVHSGTYHENVNVNKRLILQGIGVPVVTVETGSAITLAADGITLEAFTATGAGTSMNNGITVISNNNTLISNNASNNGDSGISLIGGGNCESYGIGLYSSNNNTLSGNNANGNYGYDDSCGIYLYSSSNNMLFGNNVHWNGGHLPGYGIYLEFSNNNTLTNNNADSNSGYYGGYGISLSASSNNTLNYNNANSNGGSSGGYGISLESSNSNILIGNNASYNNAGGGAFGIFLSSSSNNTLVGNNASNNGEGYYDGYPYGIYLDSSSTNLIYNNIFNNINNIGIYNSNINNWNITKQSGTNILGGSFLGGNFWANPDGTGFSQTCSDVNSDGICDSSYSLDNNNTDYLPLASPESSVLVISNIAAISGKVYGQDTLAIGKLFYIDRTYKVTGVPPSYTGLNYIKTSTDDRYRTESNFLQFDVNKDVTVYVAYDDRISPKPSWITSFFTDTGDNLVRDDSTTFSIYSRNYPAGHISLGGTAIPPGGAGGSYVVIVK